MDGTGSDIADTLAGKETKLAVVLLPVLLEELGGVDIGRRFEVGIDQHGGDADEDGLDGQDGIPFLR